MGTPGSRPWELPGQQGSMGRGTIRVAKTGGPRQLAFRCACLGHSLKFLETAGETEVMVRMRKQVVNGKMGAVRHGLGALGAA